MCELCGNLLFQKQSCQQEVNQNVSHPFSGHYIYLHMSVWCTEGRKWKTWLLTARLCSSLKGSKTTPSRTGNVRRSSSLWLPSFMKKSQYQIIKNKKKVYNIFVYDLRFVTYL